MYKVEYNINNSITRLYLKGVLEKREVEQLIQELYDNLSGNRILLLTDARDVNFVFDIEDMHGLGALTDIFYKPEIMVYEAIIITTPKETAMTTLFNLKERKNHMVKIFSTESAAMNWLLTFNKL